MPTNQSKALPVRTIQRNESAFYTIKNDTKDGHATCHWRKLDPKRRASEEEGGSLEDSSPFVRMVVGSNPVLAAT